MKIKKATGINFRDFLKENLEEIEYFHTENITLESEITIKDMWDQFCDSLKEIDF